MMPLRSYPFLKAGLLVLMLGVADAQAARSIDALVVAERFDGKTGEDAAMESGAIGYALFEGGYIEAGDSIAGLRPPPAAEVLAAISNALGKASFARAQENPQLLIILHWGSIRQDSYIPTPPFHLNPNFRARLALVSTARVAGTTENFLLKRSPAQYRNPNYPTPEYAPGGELKIAIDRANDKLIFMVLSAYDTGALRDNQAKLVWRTIISASDTEASMKHAMLSFAQSGAAYFGRNHDEVITIKAPLVKQATADPLAAAATTDDPFVQKLIKAERIKFSGELLKGEAESLVTFVKPVADATGNDGN